MSKTIARSLKRPLRTTLRSSLARPLTLGQYGYEEEFGWEEYEEPYGYEEEWYEEEYPYEEEYEEYEPSIEEELLETEMERQELEEKLEKAQKELSTYKTIDLVQGIVKTGAGAFKTIMEGLAIERVTKKTPELYSKMATTYLPESPQKVASETQKRLEELNKRIALLSKQAEARQAIPVAAPAKAAEEKGFLEKLTGTQKLLLTAAAVGIPIGILLLVMARKPRPTYPW